MIASVASADAEFNRWVENQARQTFKDAHGALWNLELKLQQLPHPDDTQAALYRLQIGLSSILDAESLIRVGTYDPHEDARLLRLLGADRVPVAMKSRVLEHESLESLRGMLADHLINMRKSLEKTDLQSMRKRVIAQWIDRRLVFGSRLPSPSPDKIDLDV